MDIRDVKKNLNRKVRYTDGYGSQSEYILSACVLRKNKKTNGFYYQAELQDIKVKSLLYCGLETIEEE